MNDIMKIIQALEDFNILLKGVNKTIKNERKKEQKGIFIDFMLAGKKVTDYTSLFSPHDFKKNDDIILSYFKNE